MKQKDMFKITWKTWKIDEIMARKNHENQLFSIMQKVFQKLLKRILRETKRKFLRKFQFKRPTEQKDMVKLHEKTWKIDEIMARKIHENQLFSIMQKVLQKLLKCILRE